ncbi:hypothetical protein ACRRTK_007395 [Alexandromys fortis]
MQRRHHEAREIYPRLCSRARGHCRCNFTLPATHSPLENVTGNPSTQEESEVGCRWPVAQSLNHRNGWISEDFQPASLAESMCFRFSEGLRERPGSISPACVTSKKTFTKGYVITERALVQQMSL